jgi:hypothetical protein
MRPPGLESPSPEQVDQHTRAVIARVQQEGTCWLSGTVWHGRAAMRVSVSSFRTTLAEAERAAAAIRAAHLGGGPIAPGSATATSSA